ncbi:MAG: hypothetical protein E7Z93_06490 [Cyanobacteria bacterium SIG32]|nr:hypothetical protein [Cyanobacteria bacterium SIG32]
MARIIKILLISLFLFLPLQVKSEELSLSTLVTVQNVPFEYCTKFFNTDAESLFYLTIASINANRFRIDEIQSKTGYVLFNAVNKEFLASVIKIDNKHSLLKVTPTNNVYYFQPGIVLNLFKYIEINQLEKPVQLKVN